MGEVDLLYRASVWSTGREGASVLFDMMGPHRMFDFYELIWPHVVEVKMTTYSFGTVKGGRPSVGWLDGHLV